MTGLGLTVQPILALPGWYVVPKGAGTVWVLSHKQLCGVIARGRQDVLSPSQIDLIARQLDVICRDVEN